MSEVDRDSIRKRLRRFISFDEGRELRDRLHSIAKVEYQPLCEPDVCLKWMNDHVPTFSRCGYQSTNHPYYFCMFTVVSQHVYGDTIEECVDRGMSEVSDTEEAE